jgi:RNA polymerase sigma-70 factor (ECF subfamily)
MENASRAFLEAVRKSMRPIRAAIGAATIHSTSRADDAVQDTIERAWRARASLIPGAELKPWIFTILRNAITDIYRTRPVMAAC